MIVTITQYLRPHGRKSVYKMKIPDTYNGIDLTVKYAALEACGCHLACEQLRTGEVIHYISHKLGDFAIVNSPAFNEHVAGVMLLKILSEFDVVAFASWLRTIEADTPGTC